MNNAAASPNPLIEPRPILSASEREHYRLAWLSTVDHKRIGILYLMTAFAFFILGGLEALLIRIQLAWPNNHFLSPDVYNQVFTMHGTTMIFLVVMPLTFGLANYILPLQIGARDMAFPRLNAFSFWMVPFGGILLHLSLLTGRAPNVGWFAYAPLSETAFSSQSGVDYWALALFALGIGSIGAAINLCVTVLSMRAPGMTLRRLPLFTWINFVNSFIILAALPVLNAGLVMLLFDRLLDAHFFLPSEGGSPILWQHIFWAFGHPEVYILVFPAFAAVSEMIPVFSRKPIFGYEFVAMSSVAIAILSFGVWAHHMFTVGLGRTMDLFFAGASLLIAIPTGVKVLNWSATMYRGRIRFDTPMLFCIAFLIQFTCGGLTGVSHAMTALDWQTKNSYYLVAHFHFVAVGAIFFALLGAIHYWFPKMFGVMLSDRLGKWTFWLMVIGFNMTFIIQHVLGLFGMPRRVYTYPALPHWAWMNMVSSIGAVIMGVASGILVWNIFHSLFKGKPAGDNPWNAWTLEWATTSPPPNENFQWLPKIRSTRPLWDVANPDRPDPVIGAAGDQADQVVLPDKNKVSVLAFIFSEIGFFGTLILAYLYFNAKPQAGPGPHNLDVVKTGFFSIALFASSLTLWLSERGIRKQNRAATIFWLAVTIILGGIFIIGQGIEYVMLFESGVNISTNLFASSFFTLTGFHGLHVCIGLIVLLLLLGLTIAGDFKRWSQSSAFLAIGYYWHFVDVVWVFILAIVYILPLLK